MVADAAILAEIAIRFGNVTRPRHFTVEDGDFECMDHDQLLHARTPETLTIEDVGNIGYDPLNECLPQGMAYFFPALARLALFDTRQFDWYPFQLALHLSAINGENTFLNYCNPEQKKVVIAFLTHILATRSMQAEQDCSIDAIELCIGLWQNEISPAAK